MGVGNCAIDVAPSKMHIRVMACCSRYNNYYSTALIEEGFTVIRTNIRCINGRDCYKSARPINE